MPEINTVPATTPGGMPIPLSVRQRMLADQLLQQQAASTNSPILRKSTGYAKLAAGLLGGLMEGGETKHLEDQQRAAAQSLALPLNGAQSPVPATADASAPQMTPSVPPQSPSGPAHGAPNNPGNLIDNAWTRSLPGYAGPSGRFASFSTPEAGVSALEANLGSYGKQGIGTLTDLTNKWAPKGDGSNNPTAYAASLAKGLGVGANDPINLGDPSIRAKLAPLIAGVEGNRAAPLPPIAPPPMPGPQAAADLPADDASEASAPGLPPGVSFGPSGPASAPNVPFDNPQAMAAQMAPASAAVLGAMGPNAGNASPEDASPATPPSAPVAQPASITAAPSDGDAAASTPPRPSSSSELDPDLMAAAAKGILNFPSSPGMSPQNAAQSSLWRAGYKDSTPSPWSGAWNGDVGSEMAREASRGAPQPSRQQMLAAALAPAPAAPDTQASPLNAAQSALWKAGYKNSTASPFTGQWGGDVGGELAREGDRGESLASMPGPDVPTIPTQPNQALASALLGNQPGGPTPPIGANIGASSDIPAMTPNVPPSPTITSDNGGGPVPVDAPIPPVRPANLGAPPPAPATPPAPRAIPPAMAATAPGSLPAPTPPPGSPSPQMLAAGLGGPTLTGRVNNSVQTPTQFNVAQGAPPSALAAALSGSPPPPAPMPSPPAPQGNSGPLAALGQAAPSLAPAPAAPMPSPAGAPAPSAPPAPGSTASPSGFNPYANVPNSVLAQYNAVVTNPYASPAMVEAAKERIAAYMPRAVPDNSVIYNPANGSFVQPPVPSKFNGEGVNESTGRTASGDLPIKIVDGGTDIMGRPAKVMMQGTKIVGRIDEDGNVVPVGAAPNGAPAPSPRPAAAGAAPSTATNPAPNPAAPAASPSTPPVPGEDYLRSLEQSGRDGAFIAGQARAIINGQVPYPTQNAATKPVDIAIMNAVLKADPNYSVTGSQSRAKAIADFQNSDSPTSAGGLVRNLNTALGHLGRLSDSAEAIGGADTSIPGNNIVNAAKNELTTGPKATALAQYHEDVQHFVEEATKFYQGSSGTQFDREKAIDNLSPNKSPSERRAAIGELSQLMQTKGQELQRNWHQAVGQASPDYPVYGPEAQQSIARIGGRTPAPAANAPAPDAIAAGAPPAAAPSPQPAMVKTLADVKTLPHGAPFIIPSGPSAGKIGYAQ